MRGTLNRGRVEAIVRRRDTENKMKVAKITSSEGREFLTNDISEDSLAKLKDVHLIEIIEMKPEDFWQTAATNEAEAFFAPLKEASHD